MSAKRKMIVGISVLVMVGIFGFMFSNTKFFKGDAGVSGIVIDECETPIDHTNYTSIVLSDKAEDYNQSVLSDLEAALSYLNSGKNATDSEELASIQRDAELSATSAETNAACSQAFADATLEKQESAEEAYNIVVNDSNKLRDEYTELYDLWQELKTAYEVYVKADENHYACIDENGDEYECENPYSDEVDAKSHYMDLAGISTYDGGAAVNDAETAYNNAVKDYTGYMSDEYQTASDAYDETKSHDASEGTDTFYYEDAQISADEAADAAVLAREYSDDVAERTITELNYGDSDSIGLEVQEYGTSTDNVEISWDSGETYTLGQWYIGTGSSDGIYVPADSSGFYLGAPIADQKLSDYFENINTKIEFGSLDATDMVDVDGTSDLYIISHYDYILTVTGKPIASKEEDFKNLKNADPKIALNFSTITIGSSEYAYIKNPEYFTFDESGFSYGGITLGEQTYACDSLSLVETSASATSSVIIYTVESSEADSADENFLGTINVETSGAGTLKYKTYTGSYISFTGTGSSSMSYKPATDGDIITASVEGEETTCTDTLTIERESDSETLTDADTLSDSSTSYLSLLITDGYSNGISGIGEKVFTAYEDGEKVVDVVDSDKGYYEISVSADDTFTLALSATGWYLSTVYGPYTLADDIDSATTEGIELAYPYMVKVTDVSGTTISEATVTLKGDSGDTYACTEVSDGLHGCVTKIDTNLSYLVKATGYEKSLGAFSVNRTDSTSYGESVIVMLIDEDEYQNEEAEGDSDVDDDGIANVLEIKKFGYDPEDTDSDDDGTEDGDEDYDSDGLTNLEELDTYETSPFESDSDEDGTDDGDEVTNGTDPLVAEEEDEEEEEAEEDPDYDDDGLANVLEIKKFDYDSEDTDSDDDGTEDGDEDYDLDDLTNLEEINTYLTDPILDDSDGDGFDDGYEVEKETDPLDDTDYPKTKRVTEESDCPFTDIVDHWSEEYVCGLYEDNIVSGRSSTLFEPDDDVTRAEFLKMIMLIAGLDPTYHTGLTVTKYSDVNPGDWYYDYVALADSYGDLWYAGSGTWQPNENITRGDAILLVMRFANQTLYDFTEEDSSFTDFDEDSYQAYAIILAEQYEIITGYDDGEFKPDNSITRAEAAVVVSKSEEALF